MRDSNNKGAEKESSDAETLVEPAVAEEPVLTPATTPTPAPTQAAPEPVLTPAPAAAPVPVAATTPTSTAPTLDSTSAAQPSQPAAVPAQPAVAAVAPKTAPETTPVAAPAATPAPPMLNPLASNAINMFDPHFATGPAPTSIQIPAKPIVVVTSNKNEAEKEDADKEDKLVAARNEENAKVSAMMKEDTPAVEKRRMYTADQWSPQNPEGKKKYDRSFLMDLRHDPQSQKKPDGLPDMEVVLKESRKPMANNFSSDFTQSFRSSSSRGMIPPQRKSQQGKPKSGKPQVIHMSISLREDVKLHETENAWRPGILASGKESTEDENKTQELYKKVRGVLNKLTPEKFDKLVFQVQELAIDTIERLEGVINLVYDKAVDEPNFSVAYAKMCNELRTKEVQGQDEKALSFRKILVTRCQREFEKNKAAEFNKEAKLKDIQSETDPEKKKELTLAYEEEERRVRMKSVGNVRFIGELFKLGMLTTPIMHRCVQELLNKKDEESLECLCKLLTTIGKKLESDTREPGLSPYFAQMKDLADKKGKGRKVSSRVRFMLQDVIDLRNNNWVPRRDDSNPKTMEQIQKEAERETIETTLALSSQPNTPRKDDRMGGRSMGSMDKRMGRGGQGMDMDGWKTASSRSSRTTYTVDTGKLKNSKPDESAQLGSPNLFSKWGGGSSTSAKEASAKKYGSSNPYNVLMEGGKPSPFNSSSMERRSMLPSQERDGGGFKAPQDPSDRGSGSRSSSRHRMGSQPSSRDSSVSRLERERDEERRNRVSMPPQAGSKSDDHSREQSANVESGPIAKRKRLKDPDEIASSSKTIMQELLNHKDIKEATLSVQDFFDWTNISEFTKEGLLFMSERLQGHALVGQLFVHLFKENLLRGQDLCEAVSYVIGMGEDLAFDIPKVWTHIAALLVPLLIGEALTFKELSTITKVLKGTPVAGVLLSNIIHLLVREKGPSWIRDHMDAKGVTWNDFLEANDVEDFLKKNNIDNFTGGALASSREAVGSGSGMTQAQIQAKLLELLKQSGDSNTSYEEITGWINANIGEENAKDYAFIRALMTAICENSLQESRPGKYTCSQETLLKHYKLLQRYVSSEEDRELQCLFAIQALVHNLQHPQGLVLAIFTLLWENTMISSEAFQAWFNNKDPRESLGKSVCIMSLTSFETMLKESEECEEDDS